MLPSRLVTVRQRANSSLVQAVEKLLVSAHQGSAAYRMLQPSPVAGHAIAADPDPDPEPGIVALSLQTSGCRGVCGRYTGYVAYPFARSVTCNVISSTYYR